MLNMLALGTTIKKAYGFSLIMLLSAFLFMSFTLFIERKKFGLKNTGQKESKEFYEMNVEDENNVQIN